jgi:tetratricopeptide (TPR) repeat protein
MTSEAPNIHSMWNFNDPAQSEQRFREALAAARGDDVLILKTQIARSHGLRGDFDAARQLLAEIEPDVAKAGFEARIRHALEWGRSWASAVHKDELQTDETLPKARAAFEQALDLSRQAHLDALAIDAVHMLAFVDRAPADQLKWAQVALTIALASSQPAAQRWEASVRNNLGYALHQLGRLGEALTQFEHAVLLRQRGDDDRRTREARWMVAWTLRSLKRNDEALAMQLQLEAENDAAGTPDGYVFEELETLYRDSGRESRAAHYAQRQAGLKK